MMEHFIAFTLLKLEKNDRYIDIGSENSPFPKIFRKRLGIEAYSQDIIYESGIHGYRIGSSADKLPISDGWVDKASLQCAFEHFQGEADKNFIFELRRVLRRGGKCVIVPLYIYSKHLNIYDPILCPEWDASCGDESALLIAEIGLGGEFERVYSPDTLQRILIKNIGLRYTLYRIVGKRNAANFNNEKELRQVMRIRYALEIEKYDVYEEGTTFH